MMPRPLQVYVALEEWGREEGGMIKWLGENGGEFVGTNKYLCVQKEGSSYTKMLLLY